jgi:hypothetical protein
MKMPSAYFDVSVASAVPYFASSYYLLYRNKTRVKRKSILHIKRVGRKTLTLQFRSMRTGSDALLKNWLLKTINTKKGERFKDNPLDKPCSRCSTPIGESCSPLMYINDKAI